MLVSLSWLQRTRKRNLGLISCPIMELFEKIAKQPNFGLFLTVAQRVVRGGLSLNEHLENGPNLIPPLYDVLVKFRCRAVGIIADMEKAFHQIEIRKSNRDQSSDILQHSQNRPTGDRWLKF